MARSSGQIDWKKLKKDARALDGPRSVTPRKTKECKRHEYLVTDRCYWCGAPMPEAKS